jgi:hypothetical protein
LGDENERHLAAIRAKDLELEDLRALFKQVDTQLEGLKMNLRSLQE